MIFKGTALGFTKDGEPIDYNADDEADGNASTVIYGAQGSMKSMGLIAVQLLADDSRERSYVIFGDGKGELTKISSKFRRTVSEVMIGNYGNVLGIPSDKYNPFKSLGTDPDAPGFGDNCQAISNALVPPEPNDHNKHFTEGARSAGYLAISRACRKAGATKQPVDFGDVREFLMQEPKKLRAAIEEIIKNGNYDERTRAAKFLNVNTEIENLKSTLEVATAWATPEIRKDMATSGGIDYRDAKKRPMTIYNIVPTKEMQAKKSYTRMGLCDCFRALYTHEGLPVTVIIEEGFVLGYHEELEKALSILRGYNSRMTVVFQSYQQTKKLYPDTHGLFTSGCLVAFRPADLETAEMLVKRAGKIIVPTLSAADPSNPGEVGVRPSWQQQVRDRIPLHKMMGMPKGRALVWKPGDEKPRVSWVKGFFDLPELAARGESNPLYRAKSATATAGTDAGEDTKGTKRGGTSIIGLCLAALIVALLVLLR